MGARVSRRGFMGMSAAACAATVCSGRGEAEELPLVDLHVHLDNSSIDEVLGLSRERGVRFGIVEHAGTEENKYPVVLSSDEELGAYLDMLEGKPVYKGVQAEWTDWASCFSKKVLARLDYVLTDAMTFPGPDGRRMKLWEDSADLGDLSTFMDRFVEWHVRILEDQPIDVFANVSWIPAALGDYDAAWTDARIEKVVEAAARRDIAIEISSGFQLPKERFLRVAKEAGLKFLFGSNGRYPKMGLLEYSLEMAGLLKLTPGDLFTPKGARAGNA